MTIPGPVNAKHGEEYYGATGVAGAAACGLVLQKIAMLLVVRKKAGIWTHATFTGSRRAGG